jgi:hypothetical protein
MSDEDLIAGLHSYVSNIRHHTDVCLTILRDAGAKYPQFQESGEFGQLEARLSAILQKIREMPLPRAAEAQP